MTVMTYDKQEGIQYLIGEGLIQKHASAIMHVVQKNEYGYYSRLATKEQVSLLENNFRNFTQFSTNKTDIDKVILELKADTGSLRSDINKVRTELKEDIEHVRTELKEDVEKVGSNLDIVRIELKTDIVNVRTELKTDIVNVRTELKADIEKVGSNLDKVRTELKADIADLRTDLDKVRIEVDGVKVDVEKVRNEVIQSEKRLEKIVHRSQVKLMLMIGGSTVTNISIMIGLLKYFLKF